jgi:hypothetical protein
MAAEDRKANLDKYHAELAEREIEQARIEAEEEKIQIAKSARLDETFDALENLWPKLPAKEHLEVLIKNVEEHSDILSVPDNIKIVFKATHKMVNGDFLDAAGDRANDKLEGQAIQYFKTLDRLRPEAHVWEHVISALARFNEGHYGLNYRTKWYLDSAGSKVNQLLIDELSKPFPGFTHQEVIDHLSTYGDSSYEKYMQSQIEEATRAGSKNVGWLYAANRGLLKVRINAIKNSKSADEAAAWGEKILSQLNGDYPSMDGDYRLRRVALETMIKIQDQKPRWNLASRLQPQLLQNIRSDEDYRCYAIELVAMGLVERAKMGEKADEKVLRLIKKYPSHELNGRPDLRLAELDSIEKAKTRLSIVK